MNDQRIHRISWFFLALGICAAAVCAWAAATGDAVFFRAYLYAYLFWLGIALGSLGMMMVYHLTGGKWGRALERVGEAAVWTLPVLALLFIPILFGMKQLYAWAGPGAGGALWRHRAGYLNFGFFTGRTAAYFVIWIIMAGVMRYWRHNDGIVRRVSAGGLIVYLMTMTHATVDWVMSRDVHFYSTAYGFLFVTGQALSGFALLIIACWALTPAADLPAPPPPPTPVPPPSAPPETPPEPPHPPTPSDGLRGDLVSVDFANLLLTLVILWAYIEFFQLLVIWMGNLRDDNGWYIERGFGNAGAARGWILVGAALVIFHFFVPFFLLLFRKLKCNLKAVAGVAGLLLAMHLVQQYWMVAPSPGAGGEGWAYRLAWVDFVTPVAIGGIWLFVFLQLYRRNAGVAYAV